MTYIQKSRPAFTLAEILITLGIISIVAAITIPNLIQNSAKQETASRLQKIYSTLKQAVAKSEIENGTSSLWTVPSPDDDVQQTKDFWEEYFIPYLSVNKKCIGPQGCWASDSKWLDKTNFTQSPAFIFLVLSDGTSIYLSGVGSVGYKYGQLFVDINGLKKPNIVGRDIFKLQFDYPNGKIEFYAYNLSRTNLLMNADYLCNKETGLAKGQYCGALIQQDGWQIKDDYPWK